MSVRWVLVLIVALVVVLGVQAQQINVTVPVNSTWSILAWGWESGGKDSVDGMKVVDVDLDTQKDQIQPLRNAGKIVICYFSIGTIEPWRDDCQANKSAWESAAVGKMADWDEEWLDIRKLDQLKSLMIPRFQRAVQQGCHGIEGDNIDCYANTDCWGKMTNPTVSSSDAVKQAQIDYNIWQANYAHQLGLLVGMKNAMGLVADLSRYYDFAVNEQCQTYNECSGYSAFTNANKAVLQVEYTANKAWCSGAEQYKLRTKYCNGTNADGKCHYGSWINCFSSALSSMTTGPSNGGGSVDSSESESGRVATGAASRYLPPFFVSLLNKVFY